MGTDKSPNLRRPTDDSERIRMEKALEAYVSAFEKLNSETLGELKRRMHPRVRFSDPFNDVQGWPNVAAIFDRMYQMMSSATFEVLDSALSSSAPNTAMLHWNFVGVAKKSGNTIKLSGMSVVQFDNDGLVTSHIDHWDAAEQFYERIPVLKSVLRFIKKKI